MSEIPFGIDLGTTFSVAAYIDETSKPCIARNSIGGETTPSAIYFENSSSVVVGETAKRSALLFPDQVVTRIKREMGLKRKYQFNGAEYSPESISALILKQVAQDAATSTGHAAGPVVITVPAYFGMLERDATKNAGEIAGLNVAGIVPEPVAAALHYDVVADAVGQTIMVYDLGGGTFDTSVIRIEPDEIRVLCTDGDRQLGGSDWDDALARFLLDEFVSEAQPAEPPEDDQVFMQDLALQAEEAKIQLAHATSRPVLLRHAGATARIEITRDQFEALTKDLLDRTIDITRRTLASLEELCGPTRIDAVILVGGSSKMPAVTSRLRAEFGWEPRLHEPDLAVAKGAALYALGRLVHQERADEEKAGGAPVSIEAAAREVSMRTGIAAEKLQEIASKETRNVLPKAFGVKLLDESYPDWQEHPEAASYIEHLVHANDLLPTEPRHLAAATVVDGQETVPVEIYEQAGARESRELDGNHPVNEGQERISGIPWLPAGSPIDISMSVDGEGLLTVTAVEPQSGQNLHIGVRVSVLSEGEVSAAKQVISGIKVSA